MNRTFSAVIPKCAWPAMIACAFMNAFVLTQIATNNPAYLHDYALNEKSDALHYVVLGRNYLLKGEYSRRTDPPYTPDVFRTPVYPLFSGGLDILGGAWAIYLMQAALQVASCLLLVHLVREPLGDKAAMLAGLLLATDFTIAVGNYEAMSEPLYLFLNLAATVCLMPVVLSPDQDRSSHVRIIAGSLLLGLAMLTRPAGLYVPIVFAILILSAAVSRRTLRQAAWHTALFLLVAAVPVGGWIARNSILFSVNHLSTNDAIMLVYFTGGGAYKVEHGVTLEEAQQMIATEYNLPSPVETNNDWISDLSAAEIDSRLRAAKFHVLTKYPASLVKSSVLGIVKSGISHNTESLAHMTGRAWIHPTAAGLLRGDSGAYRRLLQNDTVLVGTFIWQLAHSALTYVLVVCGAVVALRNRRTRGFTLVLLALLAYFYLTVAVVGVDAYYRSRIPHMPFLYAFGGFALAKVVRRQTSAEQIDPIPGPRAD